MQVRHGDGVSDAARQASRSEGEGPIALCLEVWPANDERRIAARVANSTSGRARGNVGTPAVGERGDGGSGDSGRVAFTRSAHAPGPAAVERLVELRDALVVPAGTLLQGRVRAHALLLAGEIVGTVHCGPGPVVVCAGAALKGQLLARGDVHVCGRVVDYAGGTVIATPGQLVLAPGSRIDGDVRSGHVECHAGAILNGVARAFER